MQDFEKLGVFYLGREYDLDAGKARDGLLLYDARDLTTHATIVGMTGSGKTGLALALLEEAAIDGVPSILIDPKGDLANLLLQFPELRAADFQPWVDASEAAAHGMDAAAFAAQTAAAWRAGLAQWGQGAERIQRLRDAVDLAVYTPGSAAGNPIQMCGFCAAPPPAVAQDPAALRDRTLSAVSGLLGLLGIDADPVQSREHILLANILNNAWQAGHSLDLAAIIRGIQKPPFDQVGVFDLESFYPADERLKLALRLNNLLASPGFSVWMEGDPLDVQRLLYTAAGKPRVSIISIAHLSDAERMFVVTVLLNEVLAWMRTQSGTGSLRALLYMDEIFGYFPPSANPPSKLPMLTLLKQARAYGLGVVLSTQNPVDLDYKGLSNCGTWFIGRLQTERDKMRVIEGLEGVAAGAGGSFDRAQMERTLAGLGSRVFLMRNVHDAAPVVFQTRWLLSYLRGPLTLPQIATLVGRGGRDARVAPVPTPATDSTHAYESAAGADAARPVLPAELTECFLRPQGSAAVTYRPRAFAAAKLHFVDAQTQLDIWLPRTLVAPFPGDGGLPLWEEAEAHGELRSECEAQPVPGARFAPLPVGATSARAAAEWRNGAADRLYQQEVLTIMQCSAPKLVSTPGESAGDFRVRLAQALRERRDAEVAKLRVRYAPKLQVLGDQIRRAQERVEREKAQANQQKFNTALSIGATLLGAFFGRGARVGTVGRAATAARSAGRIGKENADVERANESEAVLQERLDALQAQFEQDAAALQADIDPSQVEVQSVPVRPRKSDIAVAAVGVCWVP